MLLSSKDSRKSHGSRLAAFCSHTASALFNWICSLVSADVVPVRRKIAWHRRHNSLRSSSHGKVGNRRAKQALCSPVILHKWEALRSDLDVAAITTIPSSHESSTGPAAGITRDCPVTFSHGDKSTTRCWPCTFTPSPCSLQTPFSRGGQTFGRAIPIIKLHFRYSPDISALNIS